MLEISNDDKVIFTSSSKWLHPIFEFEEFLQTYKGNTDNLSAHDTAIGKAAAFLLIRLGIKKMHGDLTSSLAVEYVSQILGINCITFDKLVDRLQCQTEKELEKLTDENKMYKLIKARHDKSLNLS